MRALTDPDHRPMAAKFLADLGCQSASPAIMRLLEARDSWTRNEAIRALGKLRAQEAIPRLKTLATNSADSQTSLWALASLGEIGGKDISSFLIPFLRHSSWDHRRAAAYALGLLGDARTLSALRNASKAERLSRRRPYWAAMREIRKRSSARQ
jgi:HEAT repeat protein